jgi:hypothetical protein
LVSVLATFAPGVTDTRQSDRQTGGGFRLGEAHPRIEFASAKEMTSHFYESIARREQTPMVLNQPEIDVVSLYNNETKTIYLLDVAGMEKHPLSCPCWSTKWFITFKT